MFYGWVNPPHYLNASLFIQVARLYFKAVMMIDCCLHTCVHSNANCPGHLPLPGVWPNSYELGRRYTCCSSTCYTAWTWTWDMYMHVDMGHVHACGHGTCTCMWTCKCTCTGTLTGVDLGHVELRVTILRNAKNGFGWLVDVN